MTRPPTLERGELPPGATFGDYRIRRLLGRGGMGAVYEAEHRVDGRAVAIKVLGVDLDQLDARDRFLREGRSAAAINHPNTVYVYGTEEIDGQPAIVMELVADGTLEERVRARGPLPVAEVVEYAAQMVEGLAAAHDVGLLHRDVKPSNCFVAADGTLKVGDFGLSKPVDAGEQLRLTQTGLFLGTPVYSSPEQLLGEQLDVRSDIYAVGLTLYHALTGHLPYPSGSMMQVVAAVLNGAPTPIATYRPDVPPEVAAVVMKAMARRAEDRFQDYDELRAAVARLRAPRAVPAPLRDRLRAWVVDAVLAGTLAFALYLLVQRLRGIPFGAEPEGPDVLGTLVSLLASLAVVAVPEGLRGASPGKWLLRVQVARADGQRPGVPRAVARAVLLWACYPVSDLVHWLSGSLGVGLVASAVVRLAMLAPARRANGWQTVWDRLTDTRVVQPVAEHRRRRAAARPERSHPDVAGGAHVGPYVLVPGDEAGAGCAAAWDPALHRPVWLATRRPGDPPVPDARRAVARTTRLRWVGSGRVDGAGGATWWDAYSAPGGESFLRRLERPVSWEELQGWVDDLTAELTAAEQDGTLPVVPPVDALWVGATGALLIADAAPAAAGADAARRPRDLVAEMIARVRRSGRLPAALPPFAAAALDAAAAAPDPRAARDAIALTAGRAAAVSRRKRTWMLVTQFVPAPLLAMLMASALSCGAAADPEGARLDALLGYVGRDTLASPAPAEEPGRRAAFLAGGVLHRTVHRLRLVADRPSPSAAGRDSLARNRRLAEIYVATVLADHARDTTTRAGMTLLSARDRARARQLVRKHAAADPAEVRAARVLVDSVWGGAPPGTGVAARRWDFGVVLTAALVAQCAVLALAATLLLRRGPLFRLFGVDLVAAGGRPAGRLRVLARQCAAWLPALVGAALWALALTGMLDGHGAAPVGVAVLAGVPALWGAWLWLALRTPDRSVADRVAGTYLVPA